MINPKTGQKDIISMPDDEGFCDLISEDKAKIAKYFLTPKDKAIYEYDFGDGWQHEVMLEKILPSVVGTDYPQCIAGERACPPEDCGGVGSYEHLLGIISNPNHEEYEERMKWLRDDFNSEEFDPRLVEFGDHK